MINKVVEQLRKDLVLNSDPRYLASIQRFFKEPVKAHGVRSGVVGKIASQHYKNVSKLSKPEFFKLCETLFSSGYLEEAYIVSFLCPKFSPSYVKSDIAIFRRWILNYIDNWAKCDGFCNHSVWSYFEKFPKQINVLNSWAKSSNTWLKRASCVSLIVPAKEGKYLSQSFKLALTLIADSADMVQKGYGWLLKEQSRVNEKEVFEFVYKNKSVMPRTALRYAIELMSPKHKKEAMKKD